MLTGSTDKYAWSPLAQGRGSKLTPLIDAGLSKASPLAQGRGSKRLDP